MKKKIVTISISIIAIAAAIILYLSGIGMTYSGQLSDAIYQRGNIPSGTISIIGIDEHSLDELGPYHTWTRDYVAEAIETLNADPENAPAVIGIDILYVGESYPEADEHLVNAAQLEDNVVFGSFMNIDPVLTQTDTGYSLKKAVTLYEEPFEKLLLSSDDGFINGFYDKDGVIRHSVLEVELDDGRTIPSFSYEIYKKYAKKNGMDESLNIPANRQGDWYVDFTDSAGGYDNGFSISDLISGEIPPEYFADGIVLIGPYAEGMTDSYRVAIDKVSDMYGVEVHANFIEAMLDGRFKREIDNVVMAAIIALLVAVAIFMCTKKKLAGSIIYAVVACILYPLVCMMLYALGFVLDAFYVPVFVFAITVCNVIVHYIRATIEKRRVESTFKRYVAPEIVDDIMQQGIDSIKLGGEAVDCAILFVDIRGFTTMSESLSPEQVVKVLNRYLALTSSSIFKYGGTLDKFIGDATMAIFNAPLPQEDYIYKAVKAAWAMVEGSHELSKELKEEFGRDVSFGVGVHCGKAVVGNIGTDRRMDYTAIGDTVNTAARLEANAPRDTVYISKKVVDAISDRIECESIGNLPLKGKSEELEVFRLLGVK